MPTPVRWQSHFQSQVSLALTPCNVYSAKPGAQAGPAAEAAGGEGEGEAMATGERPPAHEEAPCDHSSAGTGVCCTWSPGRLGE